MHKELSETSGKNITKEEISLVPDREVKNCKSHHVFLWKF